MTFAAANTELTSLATIDDGVGLELLLVLSSVAVRAPWRGGVGQDLLHHHGAAEFEHADHEQEENGRDERKSYG